MTDNTKRAPVADDVFAAIAAYIDTRGPGMAGTDPDVSTTPADVNEPDAASVDDNLSPTTDSPKPSGSGRQRRQTVDWTAALADKDNPRVKMWLEIANRPVTVAMVSSAYSDGTNVTGTQQQRFQRLTLESVGTTAEKKSTGGFVPGKLKDDASLPRRADGSQPKNVTNDNGETIDELVLDYEKDDKTYVPDLAEIVRQWDDGGYGHVAKTSFSHNPEAGDPRYRLIVAITEPVPVGTEEQRAAYEAVYKEIGDGKHDQTCGNAGRYFHDGAHKMDRGPTVDGRRVYPRKPDGTIDFVASRAQRCAKRQPLIVLKLGKAFDLKKLVDAKLVELAAMPKADRTSTRAGARAGAGAAGAEGDGDDYTYKGFPLKAWAANFARTFKVEECFEARGLWVADRKGEGGGCFVQCFQDDVHKSKNPSRTYCFNGVDGKGFVLKCSGRAPCDGDRLQRLKHYLAAEMITIADLENPEFGGGVLSPPGGDRDDDGPTNAAPGSMRACFRIASEIEEKAIDWEWPGVIPRGTSTMAAGPTKVAKSQFALHVAARVTDGRPYTMGSGRRDYPAPEREPGRVVIITGEDDVERVVVGRLEVAGADLSRVLIFDGYEATDKAGVVSKHGFGLDKSVQYLSDVLVAYPDIRLVVIDPVNAFVGKIDAHRNNEVRDVLRPLKDVAERHNISVLLCHHTKKGEKFGSVTDLIGGSNAYAESVRSIIMLAPMDAAHMEENRFLMEVVRSNYAQGGQRYVYEIEGCHTKKGNPSQRFNFLEGEKAPMSIHELLSGRGSGSETQTLLKDAKDYILGALGGGDEVEAAKVMAGAVKAGIKKSTLRRAKNELQVRTRKTVFGEGGVWMWSLSPDQIREAKRVLDGEE